MSMYDILSIDEEGFFNRHVRLRSMSIVHEVVVMSNTYKM